MQIEASKEGSDIMQIPAIDEEELVATINNMRNGRAAGIDGIRSEVMKFIIKDETIKKHITKCYNNILNEKVHKDWLESVTTMILKEKHKILEHRPIAVTVNSSKVF